MNFFYNIKKFLYKCTGIFNPLNADSSTFNCAGTGIHNNFLNPDKNVLPQPGGLYFSF